MELQASPRTLGKMKRTMSKLLEALRCLWNNPWELLYHEEIHSLTPQFLPATLRTRARTADRRSRLTITFQATISLGMRTYLGIVDDPSPNSVLRYVSLRYPTSFLRGAYFWQECLTPLCDVNPSIETPINLIDCLFTFHGKNLAVAVTLERYANMDCRMDSKGLE